MMFQIVTMNIAWCFLFVIGFHMIAANSTESLIGSCEAFTADLFSVLVNEKTNENIVFSPLSTHACLSLILMGAREQTADELLLSLRYPYYANPEQIAQEYSAFLKKYFKNSKNIATQPQIAYRIYLNKTYSTGRRFARIASTYFESTAQTIDFENQTAATEDINTWVEEQTDHKIKNLLKPDAITGNFILVHALYFKGAWLHGFAKSDTHKAYFYNSNEQTVLVDMMSTRNTFLYKEESGLESIALKLPYRDSDLTLLLLLPQRSDGLDELEIRLSAYDWEELIEEMYDPVDIQLKLPKFKIESELDLNEPLKELGMETMFTDDADFTRLFKPIIFWHKLSSVRHKAFFEVDEGSEAVSSTAAPVDSESTSEPIEITFDHPFVYIVQSPGAVFIAGHVANF